MPNEPKKAPKKRALKLPEFDRKRTPKKPQKKLASCLVGFRVTPQEKKFIEKLSAIEGESVSGLFIRLLRQEVERKNQEPNYWERWKEAKLKLAQEELEL